ncbi:RNA recognition motif protein [Gregarina niphandrodes]|uniref:RNA recognition motif protein n=1 Tax=Gregarina niphandrodes TaxID=110365 RepID=A0A023BC10_GRENI|nr:RNA recognition motif protein [Gregarina niphandrodes]EZG81037.1 RNA recognition motif protein [Gregarina niphandrodes]|eukprot:XP_011134276.1 RNA recognition motif protein [Gregarina niphandrodes]
MATPIPNPVPNPLVSAALSTSAALRAAPPLPVLPPPVLGAPFGLVNQTGQVGLNSSGAVAASGIMNVSLGLVATNMPPGLVATNMPPGLVATNVPPGLVATNMPPGLVATNMPPGLVATNMPPGLVATNMPVATGMVITSASSGQSSTGNAKSALLTKPFTMEKPFTVEEPSGKGARADKLYVDGRKTSGKVLKETKNLRRAGGRTWVDPTLNEWATDDYRVFCGDLGNEVTDEILSTAFKHFRSFQRARVVRDSRTGKSKGYGFVSFLSPYDMLAAIKTMNRKYVGNRPIKVMKSKWKDRDINNPKNSATAQLVKEATAEEHSKTLRKFRKLNN